MRFIIPLLAMSILFSACSIAQKTSSDMSDNHIDTVPYHQIPDAPESFEAGDILSRTIDGLGYRYYWATKDLRQEDLDYLPGNDGRAAKDVLDHLYGLSGTVVNTARNAPNVRPLEMPDVSFEELRVLTLKNFKEASDLFRLTKEIKLHKLSFQRGENVSEFPIWTLLNGPLADAIYHVGQIVSFRRSSGNPMDSGVNVFMGKTKE